MRPESFTADYQKWKITVGNSQGLLIPKSC